MRTAVSLLLVTTLFAGTAFAGKPIHQNNDRADERMVFVIGSLILQRIKLKRIGTTTVSPIRIIDRREIDQTGRQTTEGVLVADPSVRAMGR